MPAPRTIGYTLMKSSSFSDLGSRVDLVEQHARDP
jgi:hypothetical protein